MNTKTTPSFIKRLDQYLLKNFPVTWSSRIHAAIIYGLGFALLLAIISFIVPNDPRNETIIHYWITLVSIISLLALIGWLIYLLRFNVFKRYGEWKSTDTLKTFILYFIIVMIIVSWSFIPPVVESIRANAKYTSEELATDINDMNIKICQLERDSIDRRFENDTFHIRNNVLKKETRYVAAPDNDTNVSYTVPSPHYYYIDTTQLKSELFAADSVKKLNDSIYVIYRCPTYTFVQQYNLDLHSEVKTLSSMELYRQVLQYNQDVNEGKLRNELAQLLTKYNPYHQPLRSTTTDYLADNYYGDKSYIARIRDKYELYSVNRRLGNITNKMYRWGKGDIETSLRVIYYITLCLTMLVLIYRHTTRRTFFLSLLTAVVLSILTGLFIAMMPYTRADNAFFTWIIAYFIIFMILSAFIFTSKTRHVIPGIALNLLVYMTPFIPLVITSLYYKSLHNRTKYADWEGYQYFENEELHFFLSEIGGFLLLIVLLATIYRMAYKKWFSSPEQ